MIINDYYMLNNRTCYHGYDLIPTSEGPTRIRHGKKSETTIQWYSLENSFLTVYTPYLIYLLSKDIKLRTFVVETYLFLKACFLSCLFWKVLTFFGICLLFQLRHFD